MEFDLMAFKTDIIEKCKTELFEEGEVPAKLYAVKASENGKPELIVMDMNEMMRTNTTKEVGSKMTKKLLKEHKAFFCIFVTEAWMSRQEAVQPKDDPDKQDTLMFCVETKSSIELIQYIIQKDSNGKIVDLTLLQTKETSGLQGRMINFLEKEIVN
jgi:hypothetical protein